LQNTIQLSSSSRKRTSLLGPLAHTYDSNTSTSKKPSTAQGSNHIHLPSSLSITGASIHSPKGTGLFPNTKYELKQPAPLFFKKETNSKKSVKAKDKPSLDEAVRKVESKPSTTEGDQPSSTTEPFELNRAQLIRLLAAQGMKDKGSAGFLSKFSLLSSKTTIGDSRQSIDKKRDKDRERERDKAYNPPVSSAQAELFRASFTNKHC